MAPPYDLHQLKNDVVTTMFVDSADHNYLIARWAYHRGWFGDFFWNAAHAIEKYLKASLLLNGQSAVSDAFGMRYEHDIVALLRDVKDIAGPLLSKELVHPPQLRVPWRNESLESFVERLNGFGDANNRYNMFSWVQRWEDLHHFDQAAFAIRRVAFRLDARIDDPQLRSSGAVILRDLLASDPSYTPRGTSSELYKVLSTQGGDELRDAGLRANFVLAPVDYDHNLDSMDRIGMHATNSVLYVWIVRRAESALENPNARDIDIQAAELADWIISNIKVPKVVKMQLMACAQRLRDRHPQ